MHLHTALRELEGATGSLNLSFSLSWQQSLWPWRNCSKYWAGFFFFASRIFWKFRTPPGPGLQKVPPDSQVLLQFHMDDCNINKLEQLLQRFHFTVLIGFYWNLSAINEYYIFQSKRPQGWWAESVLLRSVSKPSPRGAWGADLSSVHGRQHLSCIRIHSCHRRLLLMWLYFQKHRRLFDIFKWRNIVTAERWQRF